jgi:Polyketide cyclase / dehydrase and lipid transport
MEQRSFPAILLFLAAVPAFCLASEPASFSTTEGWTLSSEGSGITLYSRPRPGSSLKEFRAIGEIDAPAHAVHNVIDDIEAYPSFMPFAAECRLIEREADSIITYQRLSPKICRDRDYTLRIHETSWAGPNGLVYLNRWEPANEFGPAEKKGVVRVKVCEGGWLLEPEGATKTRATYTVYTDTGGAIPAFIANRASQIAIGRLFVAIRKQVKDPKYSLSER